MDSDLVPIDIIKRVARWWWLIVVLMVIGGILGMLFTRVQPPVYQSEAAITTAIDYAYAGRITDEDEDYLISTIGDLISSTAVYDRLIINAGEKGIQLTIDDISRDFTKSRQGYRWALNVRNADPKMAQTLNQLWVDSASEELDIFRERSLTSLKYQSAQIALENCINQSVSISPVSASCDFSKITEIKDVFSATPDDGLSLSSAILLSKITSHVTEEASLPTSAVLFHQNLNTLIGAFAGMMISICFLSFWQPGKK